MTARTDTLGVLAGRTIVEMRADKRVVHVRKHLLNPREAFWQLCPDLLQSAVRATARRFAREGAPCGDEAEATPIAESSALAIEAHALHDDHYRAAYAEGVGAALAGEATGVEVAPLGGSAYEVTLYLDAARLVIGLSGAATLTVRTAYRLRNDRDPVRQRRFAASLLAGDDP